MSKAPRVYELRLGVYATPQQAEDLKERISAMLCPDPDHAPPCPIPWSVALLRGEGLEDPDAYEHLVEQGRIESGPRP